jgi:hypothetical protein
VDDRKEHALNAVLSRASSDWDFRQQLLVDPVRALKDAFGLVLPDPFRIRFVERDADLDALIVLPDFHGGGHVSAELDHDDLEMVNGGCGGPAPWSRYR